MFTFRNVLHETKQKTQKKKTSQEGAVRTGNHL